MATTAVCNSFKAEILAGGHCFQSPQVVTGTATSGSYTVTSVSAMANIAVGMTVSGTSIQTGSVVSATTATTFTLSLPTTGTITAGTLNMSGDVFKIALIIAAPTLSGGYGANQTNYGTGTGTPTQANLGTDELASGSGYTTGGFTLTDVSAVSSGGVGYLSFSVNPSWSAATFSASAGLLYNASSRLGGVTNRCVGIFDFGGVQSVSSGVFSLIIPSATSTTALIRIS